MNATVTRLHRLLAYFENGAAAIRSTLGLLTHDPTTPPRGKHAAHAVNGHVMPKELRDALTLDQARRATMGATIGRPKGSKTKKAPLRADLKRLADKVGGTDLTPKRKPLEHTRERLKRRAITAMVLARLNPDTPVSRGTLGVKLSKGLTTLVRWGYIKPKGDGFIRTAKPFAVDDRPEQTRRRQV
jgi:hypothetical protein